MTEPVSPLQDGPIGRNATTRLILSRHSVRDRFSDQPIPDDVIGEILRCGLAAPSSKNARPWCLHVVTDRALLRDLAQAVATAEGADCYLPADPRTGGARTEWSSTVVESAATLAAVPLGIFVENLGAFSQGRGTLAKVPSEILEQCLVTYSLEVLGIGAAVMNMWLAANSLGAQAAFMGDICVAEKAIAERLGIQRDLVGVLAVGYSASVPSFQRAKHGALDESRVVWHRPQLAPRPSLPCVAESRSWRVEGRLAGTSQA